MIALIAIINSSFCCIVFILEATYIVRLSSGLINVLLVLRYFLISKRRIANMVRGQNDFNLFLQIRGIAEQDMGHFFITSSSSHFLNKTDFEQYLFKGL